MHRNRKGETHARRVYIDRSNYVEARTGVWYCERALGHVSTSARWLRDGAFHCDHRVTLVETLIHALRDVDDKADRRDEVEAREIVISLA